MTELSRGIILQKLTQFIHQEISKKQIYEWALGRAVSLDFDEISKQDPLIGETVQFMMAVPQMDEASPEYQGRLKYYQQCLCSETGEFVPWKNTPAAQSLSARMRVRGLRPTTWGREEKPEGRLRVNYIKLARVYVVLFALCALCINVLSLFDMEVLFSSGRFELAESVNIKAALPLVVYCLLLLLPLKLTARGLFFFISIFFFVFGVLYYSYITLILANQIPWFLIPAILPFSALPAIAALWLLLNTRSLYRKAAR